MHYTCIRYFHIIMDDTVMWCEQEKLSDLVASDLLLESQPSSTSSLPGLSTSGSIHVDNDAMVLGVQVEGTNSQWFLFITQPWP